MWGGEVAKNEISALKNKIGQQKKQKKTKLNHFFFIIATNFDESSITKTHIESDLDYCCQSSHRKENYQKYQKEIS